MRRISMVAGFALAMVVLAGCPKPYPNCENDEACKERGEVCVQGMCQECATDEHCKEGFTCQANKCVPKAPECTTDTQCGDGRICEAGKCAPAQCKDDAQCPSGTECQRGRCQPPDDSCQSNADCREGQECRDGRCVAPQACNWEPVRFGFNEASLSSEVQSRLTELAECIKGTHVSRRIVLEGHADERGTEEYNLQLSNRRAAAVKRYLSTLGISANQLETVGYGETRPVNPSSDEDAWSENRRVEFRR
jgi:peptidoglycan-associated lipoprotein